MDTNVDYYKTNTKAARELLSNWFDMMQINWHVDIKQVEHLYQVDLSQIVNNRFFDKEELIKFMLELLKEY